MVNFWLATYFSNEDKKRSKAVKAVSVSSPQAAAAISVALENMNRQQIFRDTTILKNILRTQHHLKMHEEKTPMCPDCQRSITRQNYANRSSGGGSH